MPRPTTRLHRRRLLALAASSAIPAAHADTNGEDANWSWRDQSSGGLYSFVDLASAGGTDLGLGTGDTATLTLPFSFPFYGSTYTSVTVTSYGVVIPGTGSDPGPWSSGSCVGDGSVSQALIAPYWGTFDLDLGGTVYQRTFDNAVVIEWSEVYAGGAATSSQTFGVIIFETGEIAFTFADTTSGQSETSRGRGGAVGVQDSSGAGVEITCDSKVFDAFSNGIYLTPWGLRHFSGEHAVADVAVATLSGAGTADHFGQELANASDQDGDGIVDLLVGAPDADASAGDEGAAWIFSGGALDGSLGTADAIASVSGTGASDGAATALAGGADMDGDGIADVVLGVPYDDAAASNAGSAALFLGELSGDLTTDEADAVLLGEAKNDYAGLGVAFAGDVNGDGYADLVVGAPYEDSHASNAGMVYLVLGSASPADVDLGSADASWYGEAADDHAGYSVEGVGDTDNDGYDDFVVGAYGNDDGGADAGAIYIVPGDLSLSGSTALATLDEVKGESAGDSAGIALAPAGDLNGDGRDDLFVGAFTHGSANEGAAYALRGRTGSWPSGLGAASARVEGASADRLGGALASLDLSGDGDRAMVAGAYGNSDGAAAAGAIYFVDHGALAIGSLDLASEGAWGKVTGGDASGYLGAALAPGDFDGNGFDDLAAGAWGADGDATASGVVYVLPGRPGYPDMDGDGHIAVDKGGLDCDDGDADLGPGVPDLCDGIDNNCDGEVDEDDPDTDGDGTADCIDTEECDGLDNDGDGLADEDFPDTDGDGTADCLDVEECDGLDNDGDGVTDESFDDTDGDGIADCVDWESCDGLDNDGDGEIDEDFEDTDGDGTPDCIDTELCDGVDNDGDGDVDEDLDDSDGDGVCDELDSETCDGADNDGDGRVDEGFDDNDGDGVADCVDGEECDGIDNNGDGTIDEGYHDTDGDGTADCVDTEECDGIDNDGDGLVDEASPDADHDGTPDCMDSETCDGIDNDGDGDIDEDSPDTDGDGAADCIDAEECDGRDNDGDGITDEGFADEDGNGVADCVDLPAEDTAPPVEEDDEGCQGCASGAGSRGSSAFLLALALLGLIRRRRVV